MSRASRSLSNMSRIAPRSARALWPTSANAPMLGRVLGSAAGGALLAAAFPPHDIVWLAPPALALLTLSWRGVRTWPGFWLGLLTGFAFLLPHILWMRVIGDDAWILLSALFAPAFALIGAGVAWTSRLKYWVLAVPLLWVTSEAIRDREPFGGFPWGRLAFSQTNTSLTPYAAIAGAPGVTFALAAMGSLLAFVVVSLRRPRAVVAALIGIAIIGSAGGLVPLPTQGQVDLGAHGGPATVVAAVVQGNVPAAGLDAFGERAAVLLNHVHETEKLAADVAAGIARQPDLVIWPENSTDIDPLLDAAAASQIQHAADAINVPILVGAVVNVPSDPSHIWNTGIVWLPTSSGTPGPSTNYVKQHPVPFGEWIPARAVLSALIPRFGRIPRDFAAGPSTGVLQVGPARLGDLICFEVAYDSLATAAVRGDGVPGALAGLGARIITVQTNNATYGHTGQPEQQLAMSRLRAVEHGRAVLIAATSGISAIIAPDGSMVGLLGEYTAGYLVESVPLRDELTISDRLGAVPELVAVLASIALLFLAYRGRRRDEHVGSATDDGLAISTGEAAL